MSECQVKAVRGSEESMMEPLESIKEGGDNARGEAENGWREAQTCTLVQEKGFRWGVSEREGVGVQEEADGAG